jgi:hypothetical protein
MRAYSVFANGDTNSVVINFSDEFLHLSVVDKLDILDDATFQLRFIRNRLTEKAKQNGEQ